MPWQQVYDPLDSQLLSAAMALLPAAVILIGLAGLRWKAHIAALAGLVTAALTAIFVCGQPPTLTLAATLYGMAYGFMPIGWIILNLLFFFSLTRQSGLFEDLQHSLTALTADRRLQLVLVAFCFGAFLEGAAGFGTPVAVSASILTGLGFPALPAAGLSLLANTAPVPFAGLGTPLIALQTVTGLDLHDLTRHVALQLSLLDVLIPFWLVAVFCGLRRSLEIWPALLIAGLTFAAAQLATALLHGPWLVNIVSSLTSLVFLVVFLRFWKPRRVYRFNEDADQPPAERLSPRRIALAWAPWLLLSSLVFIWGLPPIKTALDSFSLIRFPVPGLHLLTQRMPPISPEPQAIPALFDLPWLSTPGTAILVAALLFAAWLRLSLAQIGRAYLSTLRSASLPLLTIMLMMSVGFVMRYSGLDGILGLAFAKTGGLYPFFAVFLGWIGVAVTGSDTSSNVLFGSMQRISAEQLGLNPAQIAAANSSGGVMGKMVNPQSIVVASTSADIAGQEGAILRYVLKHSLLLAILTGLLVMALVRLLA